MMRLFEEEKAARWSQEVALNLAKPQVGRKRLLPFRGGGQLAHKLSEYHEQQARLGYKLLYSAIHTLSVTSCH